MRIRLLLLFCLSSAGKIFSQYDDAQLWQNLYIERNILQRLLIHVNEEARITENLTRPTYIYTDWGLTYKWGKHVHLTLAYVPILKRQIDDYISFRHQYYFDVVLKQKVGRFILYDRQMVQNQINDINRTADWNIPDYYLRNKVTVKYKIKGGDFIPYAAEELYYQWNDFQRNGREIDRMRIFAGCFYELNPLNEFELYYLVERHFHSVPPHTNWIIGVGYAWKMFW